MYANIRSSVASTIGGLLLRRKIGVSSRPFLPTLHKLLRGRSSGATQEDRLLAFSQLLGPASAARLAELAQDGGRVPLWLVEECAGALGIKPDFFAEWRLGQIWRYDVAVVGPDAALRNLADWVSSQEPC